ncbi:MAG: type II toxin-antitoxin system MqsA family antitoxin [Scytonema sp. PMC 1069.18]|nr:type II toxin-antitoxin system MqsA family antitoxin [Scytonema sp. PMC 1069.18]MEC4887490.1 type II toxin-antitoxin system MqsA family antitoxin [Scytonema sp. PMC 1070.18]
MKCDICGSEGVNVRRVTRTYGQGEDLLVIENIPVISCPACGESYLSTETLHEIEKIKRNRKNLAVARLIEVATFDEGSSPIAV